MEDRGAGPGLLRMAAIACALTLGCGGTDQKGAQAPEGAIGSTEDDLQVPKVDPSLCDADGKRVETFDLNRDHRPEVWKVYDTVDEGGTSVEVLTCKQVDYDRDGEKDYVATYARTGEMIAEEFDFTFDGRFDAREHYDEDTGEIYLVERDSDHDKEPDIWEKYDEEGELESVRRDRNGDGKPDVWEQYVSGELVAILYDDDFDNRVDRKESREAEQTASGGAQDAEGEGADLGVEEPLEERKDTGEEPAGPDPAPAGAGD